ncbi:hypothetical protein LSAT2_029029 [Lamellibrachia satsuma]|nr:hypothetical protein LSAT2_029029 [Lamellibrachia satsuma]
MVLIFFGRRVGRLPGLCSQVCVAEVCMARSVWPAVKQGNSASSSRPVVLETAAHAFVWPVELTTEKRRRYKLKDTGCELPLTIRYESCATF